MIVPSWLCRRVFDSHHSSLCDQQSKSAAEAGSQPLHRARGQAQTHRPTGLVAQPRAFVRIVFRWRIVIRRRAASCDRRDLLVTSLMRCSNWRRSANRSANSLRTPAREVVRHVVANQRQVQFERPGSRSQCYAVLQAERSHLVDETGSRADHLVAHAMQRLKVSVLPALDRGKLHRRPRGGFGDSLGVDVPLVRLHSQTAPGSSARYIASRHCNLLCLNEVGGRSGPSH